MDKYKNAVAVVTGSSSGIGAEISKELIKYGVIVVGLARRMEKLQKLSDELSNKEKYPGKFYPLKCDIMSEKDIRKSFEWIKNNVGSVRILVNNAAILKGCSITEITDQDIREIYDTNVKGLVLCAQEALKSMLNNSSESCILNINSIVGVTIPPEEFNDYLLYTSTKHAGKILNESLRREIIKRKANIKVTNICPGLVYTEMTESFSDYFEDRNQYLDVNDVAQACITVLTTPSHVLISELAIRPLYSIL